MKNIPEKTAKEIASERYWFLYEKSILAQEKQLALKLAARVLIGYTLEKGFVCKGVMRDEKTVFNYDLDSTSNEEYAIYHPGYGVIGIYLKGSFSIWNDQVFHYLHFSEPQWFTLLGFKENFNEKKEWGSIVSETNH